MKKKAFLQALLLVILLTSSWLILLNKLKKDSPGDIPATTAPATTGASSTTDQAGSAATVDATDNDQATEVPAAWKEWTAYLERQATPGEMRLALEAMRDSLFSLSQDEARARLLELINSGYNLQTGLRFAVGRGGTIQGAADLQALLLDWLYRLDPVAAAELAKGALQESGYSLGADAFVIHLRNYTRGSQDASGQRDLFIRDQFTRLLSNPAWTAQPSASIAHAMDFAVFLGDGSLVRELSGMLQPGSAPGIAHASSMAIERLMDIDPIPAATALIDNMQQSGMHPTTRAGFIARLDPGDPEAFAILTEYLEQPATSREEAIAFLQFFPNLNRTFSNNLVSPEISITSADDHVERLRSALEAVQDWQADGIRNDIAAELRLTGERLTSQVTGNPAP